MPRIHVTGNAGSGKSTLARRLGDALDLPVHSLDSVVWGPRWRKTPPEERRVREEELLRAPTWIIEGVSARVREAADTVIFLDVPRWLCLGRCLRRNLPYLFRSRPGLPPHCPEILIAATLVRIIWQFPTRVRPAILASPRVVRLRPGDALPPEFVTSTPGNAPASR